MKTIQGVLLIFSLAALGGCGDDGAKEEPGDEDICAEAVQRCYAQGICRQEIDDSELCFGACYDAHESEAAAEACIEQTCSVEETTVVSCLFANCPADIC